MLSAVTAFLFNMPLKIERKKEIIQDIKENIDKQKVMIFVGIRGLGAKEIFDLREKLKKSNSLLLVSKKTLLNIAFKEKRLKINWEKLEGEIALVFGFKDEILPAKIIHQFSLSNENLKILGGVFKNKFIQSEEIITLAKLQSKEELLTKLIGNIFSPISGFVNVLKANIKGLILALNAIGKYK